MVPSLGDVPASQLGLQVVDKTDDNPLSTVGLGTITKDDNPLSTVGLGTITKDDNPLSTIGLGTITKDEHGWCT